MPAASDQRKAPQESPLPSNANEWSAENSALFWWTSLEIWQHPGNVLLAASVPFCAGAYFGYKKPTEKLEALVGDGSQTSNGSYDKEFGDINNRRQLGIRTAARAFRLATLGTVGAFGLGGAALFYVGGYESVDQYLSSTRIWASAWHQSFERWLGLEDRPSRTHPEVVATKHMTEDEELNYLYEKYIKEDGNPLQVDSEKNEPTAKQ